MHLGVLRPEVITTLEDLNALADRLVATGLFNEVAFNLGESLPRTFDNPRPVQKRVGRQRDFINWTWEWFPMGTGFGGNNAFEMSRIPQLWNWMDYAYRQRELGAGTKWRCWSSRSIPTWICIPMWCWAPSQIQG
jgi:hypothetical protein